MKKKPEKVVDIETRKKEVEEAESIMGPSITKEPTLTHLTMLSQEFQQGLGKLIHAPKEVKLGSVVRYWLGRFGDLMWSPSPAQGQYSKLHIQYEKTRIELAEMYADKDEAGKPVMEPIITVRMVLDEKTKQPVAKEFPQTGNDGQPLMQYSFKGTPGAAEEFQKELNDLLASVPAIPFHKIDIDLVKIEDYLTSNELFALEGIINWIMPEEKGEKK